VTSTDPDRDQLEAEPALMTIAQAARYMNMSETWIRERTADGTLVSVDLGTRTRYRKADLDAFIEQTAARRRPRSRR
jgi:excisionase family DNA binding protein